MAAKGRAVELVEVLPELQSHRDTAKVEWLIAVMASQPDGNEGVVRRMTPYGPQAMITDDPGIADALLKFAGAHSPWPCKLVRFRRES